MPRRERKWGRVRRSVSRRQPVSSGSESAGVGGASVIQTGEKGGWRMGCDGGCRPTGLGRPT
jgi:hypothetical protein